MALGLDYTIWVVLVVYFAGMLLVGWWSKRRVTSREGYLLGERLRRQAFVGLAIALAGAMLIALEKGLEVDDERVLGNLLTLGAAVAWGSYTALNRSIAERLPAATLAFYTTIITLPIPRSANITTGTQRGLTLDCWGTGGVYRVLASGRSPDFVPFGVVRPLPGTRRFAGRFVEFATAVRVVVHAR